MKCDALIVFARAPVAGEVKTRLTPAFTPRQAAALYEAFVRDSLAQYLRLGVAVRLYLAPPAKAVSLGPVPDEGITLHEQRGKGLGARMLRAFVETFAAGYERIVIVGTDHPSLPPDFIHMAFEALAEPLSICIGPSEDGGYYLLGMNDLYAGLFAGMTYSHANVFSDTMARIGRTRAGVTVLPAWYDVDTVEDVQRLARDLDDPAIDAPRTRAALQEVFTFLP